MNSQQKQSLPFRSLMVIGFSSAFLLVTPVLIFIAIGLFLDNLFKTTPTITIFTGIFGVIGGTMNIMRIIKIVQNPEFKEKVAKEQKSELHP